MAPEAHAAETSESIDEQLDRAYRAYQDDDSATVTELCRAVIDAEPDNPRAWELLAKFGGWDSKLYTFDIDFAIDAAKHALALAPESSRYDMASEIYAARKMQIAHILESEMMMPSYTAAKQLHGTMGEWQRLLLEIPFLSVSLIEGEVSLVENLCLRSKLGIMPGDRLVYTAYASLNGKETYGETFRKALATHLEEAREGQAQQIDDLISQAEERQREIDAQVASGTLLHDQEQAALQEVLDLLESAVAGVKDQSNKVIYQQQLEELEKQLANLKPLKFFKRQVLGNQIAATKEKIAQVDSELAQAIAPLEAQIRALRSRLESH